MGGHNLPPGWDRVNVSKNLVKAPALPALPLITPLNSKVHIFWEGHKHLRSKLRGRYCQIFVAFTENLT